MHRMFFHGIISIGAAQVIAPAAEEGEQNKSAHLRDCSDAFKVNFIRCMLIACSEKIAVDFSFISEYREQKS